ncbi:unnamed protein product [Caenorhabditis bovis]|uniref:Mediator of RNA polymerase II transcription subunit 4 n=1 Tax=Caenorhabditis bovis TaxID=2654633 RepID=A0A8S1EVZ2_9PELO|nr:unnamed protein product [Caenorhabditis bovis]
MNNDRSLRDLLLESADDLECVVKQIIDSLLNRDKNPILRGGETVTNLVKMFDAKQDDVRKLLGRVPEFQERQKLICELRECVRQRDEIIQDLEFKLKSFEVALNAAAFTASKKLKAVREADLRPVNSETVIKLAHQISRSYSIAAPFTWQLGDPSRPFPQEHEFRNSALINSKPMSSGPHPIGVVRNPNQIHRTPPIGRSSSSPMFSQVPQNMWSPRYPQTSQEGMMSRGVTPNQTNRPWAGGPTTPSQSPFHKRPPTQSPLVSPRLNLKITGLPQNRVAPPPVRNVEQMSSDSSSSSSSEDESGKP